MSPTLPGSRHDIAAAREHGILDAIDTAELSTLADTGRYRPPSQNQKDANTAHARQRGPGERANAELKSWKILRKIRSSPRRGTTLVKTVQTIILASGSNWKSLTVSTSEEARCTRPAHASSGPSWAWRGRLSR